ncbi:CsiV family protein [Alteromonas oceanisediminis]|uniref:CsiV family protein n=1 Tax=Alteromonas oceanisediminis TaxID=2836180 RepID=UPI001BDA86C7|nr:CsiV family protein [Alteromonas oceanisediminis]MBT0587265.1 hypothetical protein [Alteromonas oceanisediminis]
MKHVFVGNNAVCWACTAFLLAFTAPLAAQEQWWFDIEVIVFERSSSEPVKETFETVENTPSNYVYDLFTDYLTPDITGVLGGLPLCSPHQPYKTLTDIIADHATELAQSAEPSAPTSDSISSIPATDTTPLAIPASSQKPPLFGAALSPLQSVIQRQDKLLHTLSEQRITQPSEWRASARGCIAETEVIATNEGQLRWPDTHQAAPAQVPKRIDGRHLPLSNYPHFIPASSLELTDFAKQINRLRDHRVLNHSAWRQEVVFGRDVAPAMRLIAGDNYRHGIAASVSDPASMTPDYRKGISLADRSYEVQTSSPSVDFFADLYASLNATDAHVDDHQQTQLVQDLVGGATQKSGQQTNNESPLWAVDGEFKVYLQYINRVPYLHIDSELVYQHRVADGSTDGNFRLQAVSFNQLRRVISQQIHYFDHPLFGLVVQIRRYERPDPDLLNQGAD